MRVVQVLWGGGIGGAERVNASLATEFRRLGVDARILFVGPAGPLAEQLDRTGVPYASLNFPRGSAVVRCPGRLAEAASLLGADAAILVYVGYLGVALRLGGYSGKIIGVEHGALLVERASGSKLLRLIDRAAAIPFYDAEVAISRFMLTRMRSTAHVRRLALIPHGVEVIDRTPETDLDRGGTLKLGHVSRLVSGKGADVAIRALAALMRERPTASIELHIAGDGPDRAGLEELVASVGLCNRVRFWGLVQNVTKFWSDKHVAVALDDHFVESFGMSALEAMSCGKPLIVSRVGALPELVRAGRTGFILDPADPESVARILERYLDDPQMRAEHGQAARHFAASHFSLERCAQCYLDLLGRT